MALISDFRAAVRALSTARGFTAIAVCSLGAGIALAVIIFVLSSTWLDRLVLAVVAGLVPLYYYVIAPKRVEKRLRAANHASRTILLEFGKDGVSIDVANGGPVKTSWYEFTRATVTKRGSHSPLPPRTAKMT